MTIHKWITKRDGSKGRLLGAVLVTVALGAILAIAVTAYLTWLVLKVPLTGVLPADDDGASSAFLEVLKLSLAVVAGIGGVVALVVAYRRQHQAESDEGALHNRYRAAAEQLGSADPLVRLAGAYAFETLASEWTDQRQQCVNVLCAYLRLPWLESGDATPDAVMTATEHSWTDGSDNFTVRKTYEGRFGEGEVRRTVIRLLINHLRSEAPSQGWSSLDFDLTGATLPACDFSNILVNGSMIFDAATFADNGETLFSNSRFRGSCSFSGAMFRSEVTKFDNVHFEGPVTFDGATFRGRDTYFSNSKFTSNASFQDAVFQSNYLTSFSGCEFRGAETSILGIRVGSERSYFEGVYFGSPTTTISEAMFGSVSTSFDGSAFCDAETSFGGVHFSHKGFASFQEVEFACPESRLGPVSGSERVELSTAKFNVKDPVVSL